MNMNALGFIAAFILVVWVVARLWTAWECLRCGRRVCAWCKRDLGPAPTLKAGEVTHGICPKCRETHFPEDVR